MELVCTDPELIEIVKHELGLMWCGLVRQFLSVVESVLAVYLAKTVVSMKMWCGLL